MEPDLREQIKELFEASWQLRDVIDLLIRERQEMIWRVRDLEERLAQLRQSLVNHNN